MTLWTAALFAPSCCAAASSVQDKVVALLCDKRVALLGELPSHGEARAFAGKAVVAKALVQRCGFDTVLFEAPVYEFVALEPAFARQEATTAQLDDAIGKLWWANELADWRGWLLAAANAGRLRIGGIDDQVSSTSSLTRERLPALVAGHVPEAEREPCQSAVRRHLEWSYDGQHDFDDAAKRELGRCAGTAAADAVSEPGDDGPLLASFDGFVMREIGAMSALDRDAAMQRNLLWQLRRLPPDAKVVVWTANVHAAKLAGGLQAKPMGAWLAESLGDALGSVAFTALAGQSSMAGHKPVPLEPLGPDSLEAKALGADRSEAFLSAAALRQLGTVPSRLYGKPAENDWATRFDGVVVFREEQAPEFAPRLLSAPKSDNRR
jgi:erythromycin esterase-like protein